MLRFEKIVLNCDKIEEESFIPDIKNPKSHAFFMCDDSVDSEEAEKIGNGMIHTVLPYKMQNDYAGRTEPRVFKAAVLENEFLRAVFIPELGGRLWSLYDKKYNKALIYENGSVNIANLALCNAWFAGGVEWNVGMKGHSPFTCRPLFAKRCVGEGGNDILCMYEYEEIRGVLFSMYFTLLGAELLVKVKIKNTKDSDTHTYWWSNIAVAEEKNRIYVPAESTYVTSYRDGGYKISKVPVKEEMSYPRHTCVSKDYFYDIPSDRKKWIACLDNNGVGLFHTSSDNLVGRKTFLWGTGRGGEHWNSRLVNRGNYIEIQAGLAKTQFEHLPLGAGEEICFTESYSLVDLGKDKSYKKSVLILEEKARGKSISDSVLAVSETDFPEVLGSPRGFLIELMYGKKLSEELCFPKESLTDDFRYYYSLLMGEDYRGDKKTAFVSDLGFRQAILKKEKLDSFDYYALSIIDYANGNYESAVQMINRSLNLGERVYSLSAAALLAMNVEQDGERAFLLANKAIQLDLENYATACLFADVCASTEKYVEFLEFYRDATPTLQRAGRLRMFVGKFLVELNRIAEAEKYINKDLSLPDIREGEYSMTNIWIEMYRKKLALDLGVDADCISDEEVNEKYPIPYEIDFRMH